MTNADLIERMNRQGGDIVLTGTVDSAMAACLLDGLKAADGSGDPLIVELTTTGGDAEIGRRMTADVDRARARLGGRRLVFLGTACVYSAGITLMSAFRPEDRFVTTGTMLLVHGRQLEKTVELSGPIRASRALVQALLRQIEVGSELEHEGFERLIEGSEITFEEVCEKALYDWYLPADEARSRGLIAEVI